MNLEKYIESLQNLVTENPELKTAKVICASDDEGNSYQLVNWEPIAGFFENEEFYPESESKKANAVCVN